MTEEFEDLYNSVLVILYYMEEERKDILTDYVKILSGVAKFSHVKHYDDLLNSIEETFAPFFSEVKIEGMIFEEIKSYIESKSDLRYIQEDILDYFASLFDSFDELFIRRSIIYSRIVNFYEQLILGDILTDLNYRVCGLEVTLSETSIQELQMKLKNT